MEKGRVSGIGHVQRIKPWILPLYQEREKEAESYEGILDLVYPSISMATVCVCEVGDDSFYCFSYFRKEACARSCQRRHGIR